MDRSVVDLLPVQVRKLHEDGTIVASWPDLKGALCHVDELYTAHDTFPVETADGATIVACPYNITPSGHYFDPASEKTYSWTGEVVDEAPQPVSPLAKALSAELSDKYAKKRFPQGIAGAFDGQPDSASLYFVIYAQIDDTKNNRWEYRTDSGALEGNVRVEYVCREDINMHFSQDMPYSARIDNPGGADQEDLIAFILKHVSRAGDQVQSALVEQQEAFYNDHLKRLRRQLPVTRAKMDWYPIGAHGAVSSLRNKYATYKLQSDLESLSRGQ